MPAGTPAYGLVDLGDGTTTTANYPIGEVGDLILCWVATGETSDTLPTCDTPGFVKVADVAGGSGAFANNGGVRHLTLFAWEADSTISGTITCTVGGSSANRAIMSRAARIPKSAGETWAVTHATVNKSTASTSLSSATAPTLAFTAGDAVILAGASAFDTVAWSAEAVSATGATFSALTERAEDATTSGFDAKLVLADGTVTAGTATAATTATATFSASATAGIIVTRLSVGAAAESHSGGSTTTVTVISTGAGRNPDHPKRRLLEVVASISALATDASGQAIYDRYSTDPDYTVTLWESGTAAPDLSAYDVVWLTNSCPIATTMTAYDAATVPVIASGVRSPHTNYATTGATNGATQDFVHLKAAGVGDPTVPPSLTTEQDVTVLDTAFNTRYVLNTQLGTGHHQIACVDSANLPRLTFTRYNAGDAMASSVAAPSKRAWFLLHPGSIGTNAMGWGFFDALLEWAAPLGPDQKVSTEAFTLTDAVSNKNFSTSSVEATLSEAVVTSSFVASLETYTVTDTSLLQTSATKSAFDSFALADTSLLQTSDTKSAVDSFALADNGVLSGSGNPSASDAFSQTEGTSVATIVGTGVDTATQTELAIVSLISSVVDTLAYGESVSLVRASTAIDTSTTNESTVIAIVGSRSDLLTLVELGDVNGLGSSSTRFYEWNGTTAAPLTLEGVWNGATIEAVTYEGPTP